MMDDDSAFADLFENLEAESDPTARGIVQCLRMLAEEASTLRMDRTLAALEAAIKVCSDEGDTDDGLTPECDMLGAPPGARLH